MKIAHVVTYTSDDGAFGGPTRVAFAQAKALSKLGHDVTVFAGSPDTQRTERFLDGFRLITFPTHRLAPFGGFATLWPRGMQQAIERLAPNFDVAHVHLARDLATLPAVRAFARAGVSYVTQSHGMIDKSDRLLARILDRLATRRALTNSKNWLVLTQQESTDLSLLASPAKITYIANGVEVEHLTPLDDRPNMVLFLARLHPRKRPLAFVNVAKRLMDELPDTEFIIAGPDEGEGESVRKAIQSGAASSRLKWIGPVSPDDTQSLMRRARVYVLPSFNEVFPMSVLEAFAAGTPVVTTSSLGIADACGRYGAALITDGSEQELADATRTALVNGDVSHRLREGATNYLKSELDVTAVAKVLEIEYARASNQQEQS